MLVVGTAVLICTSCDKKRENYESSEAAYPAEPAVADTVSSNDSFAPSSSSDLSSSDKSKAGGSVTTSPERKFIRTAEIKFRVPQVAKTTEAIEDLAHKYDGFVTQTDLKSVVVNTSTVAISADSLLESTEYSVENYMTIRVPNEQLDTLLKQIGQLAHFLDYRLVHADDISLQLLSNNLRMKRSAQATKRYTGAIDSKGRKLGEVMQAEDNLLALQNDADQRSVENLSYLDQVNYSTVKLQFYQRSTFRREKIADMSNVQSYEPGLFLKMKEAFAVGWDIFEGILLFLVRIWALLLLGIGSYIAYRKYGVRLANKSLVKE
jgi:hypothetical protein